MKNLGILAVLLVVLYGCQSSSNQSTEPKAISQYTIEQFMDNESVFGGSIAHDKSNVLVSSNRTGIFNAYAIPVDGSEATPLTESTEHSVYAISYFPNDDRLLFQQDNNGDEVWHIYVRELDGTVRDLTPQADARASFYGWAHDGNSFYYGYTNRDPSKTDVYRMSIENFESTLLYQNDENYSFGGVSNDEKWMALVRPINSEDTDLFLYNFETKEVKKISQTVAQHSPADFSGDNESLLYLTDDGGEFRYLMSYNIASGEREKVLEERWDIVYAYFSHGGKYRVVGINEDGKTVVNVTNMATGQAVQFPTFEGGSVTSVNISRDERVAAFYVGSSITPSNLYTYDFSSKQHKQLTQVLNADIKSDDLVNAQVVRYLSFDETPIPAIYYKPHQATADQKVPALVWVHGGPGGQSRQGYSALIQYLVNHGYAVLAVNNRGSSGYGRTFNRMDNKQHGEGDLLDCIEGKNWLAERPYIDANRIGIIGGSYGGFMVMAALTQHPEAFEAGVNIYGVTNWPRTLKSIPPWWESFKTALYDEMGDPYNPEDSVRLYNISPLFHADKVAKPVMVLQGAQDPRVLKVESDEIVEAVRENNVPVEYVLFEDEGHGFVKKENQIEAYSKILAFVDRYLKNVETVSD